MEIVGIIVLILIAAGGIVAFADSVMDGDQLWSIPTAAGVFLCCWGINALYEPVMERLAN